MESTTNLEFKYLGDTHTIDINTLLISQFHYISMITEIQKQLFPDIKLSIKIKSFEQGSFDINQLIQITTITGALIFDKVNYVSQIFKFLQAYIDIKKILKDSKPIKIDDMGGNSVSITINGDNNKILVDRRVFDIYKKDQILNNSLIKNMETLDNDQDVKGIQIVSKDNDEKLIDIDRSGFPDLCRRNPYFDEEIKEKIVDDAILYIRKLEISPKKNSKWDFIYDGRNLNSVLIRDEEFLRKVSEGERFGNGDRLRVRMMITQKYDIQIGTFIDERYEILAVKDIIYKQTPNSLF